MTTIISTTQAEHLGKIIKKNSKLNVVFLRKNNEGKRLFPDGEVYVRVPDIAKIKDRIVILYSGALKPNNGLVELRMVLGVLNKKEVNHIDVFFLTFRMEDKIRFGWGN